MLKYKIDVYDALKRKGFTTYKAKTTNLLSQNTLNKIKNEDTAITLKALNAVCNILEMQPGQLSLNSIMFLLIPRPKTNCLFTPRNTFILSTSSKYIISFSLFIICFSNTSYFSHFLLLSIPCVFYTITGRQKSLYFYHIKFFISLTLPIMNPIN